MLFQCRVFAACMSGLVPFVPGNVAAAVPFGAVGTVSAAMRVPSAALRPKIEVRTRSRSAAAPAYTIDDIGMPASATYPSSSPVGFNNSGQIFGTALRKSKGDRYSYAVETDCLVWTGARFVDLEPSLTVRTCTPYAINVADSASGTYAVVGTFSDIHDTEYYDRAYELGNAFYATIAASGSFTVESYDDHSPAALFGINSTGTAVGTSYYYTNDHALFTSVQARPLDFVQPSCATTGATCPATVAFLKSQTNGEPLKSCAFGGCTINDGGTVLGYDPVTSFYALYTLGAPGLPVELPLPIAKGSFGYVVALNNANQLVYFSVGSPTVSYVYNVSSGATTAIPPVAGTSCVHYYPVSINNEGTVLGFASFCKGQPFYFIWDAVRGTQKLDQELPANAYTIRPIGINDKGQILISLETSTGATHWGTLDPVAAAVRTGSTRSKEMQHAR